MNIINIDNQIDNIIDNIIDLNIENNITSSSLIFPSGPINVLATEIIQITNYPLLNGIYTRGFQQDIGYYYIKDDYYLWKSFGNPYWAITDLITNDDKFISEDSDDGLLLPTTNWVDIFNTSIKIPIIITAIG
jgi:hypothetical protein